MAAQTHSLPAHHIPILGNDRYSLLRGRWYKRAVNLRYYRQTLPSGEEGRYLAPVKGIDNLHFAQRRTPSSVHTNIRSQKWYKNAQFEALP